MASHPTETAPLAGLLAARHHRTPLVTDHRHLLGVGRPHFVSRPERRLLLAMDRHVVGRAALAVNIASTATERAAAMLPDVPRAFVPTGWGEDAPEGSVDRQRFRVVHAGWLYPFFDPRPLLRGLARLVQLRPDVREDLRLELLGSPAHVAGVDLAALVRAHGLPRDCVHHTERLPRPDAMARAARAAVLVAFDDPHGLQVPSKLYDYAQLDGDLLFFVARNRVLWRSDGTSEGTFALQTTFRARERCARIRGIGPCGAT